MVIEEEIEVEEDEVLIEIFWITNRLFVKLFTSEIYPCTIFYWQSLICNCRSSFLRDSV